MKKIYFILTILLSIGTLNAQFDFKKVLKEAENSIKKPSGTDTSNKNKSTSTQILEGLGNVLNGKSSANEMTQSRASEGLKAALKSGTDFASGKLGSVDGFLADAAVKILFPPEAKKIENTLRKLGMNKQCDNVINTVNRAAESAVVEAKPIFAAAITNMTITDAINILTGGQGAATAYLRRTSGQELANKFQPIIQSNLNKSGATKHWTSVMSSYNRVPMVEKVNPNLTDYVTQKAIDGVFLKVAEEENKIRTNPTARVGGIIKDVFGWADQQKTK